MWQSPLPEMIVLRKMLDDDDVDEVFFCAEIEYQKDRRLAFMHFYTHSLPTKSVFFTVQYILTMKTKTCQYKDICYAEIRLLKRIDALKSGGAF